MIEAHRLVGANRETAFVCPGPGIEGDRGAAGNDIEYVARLAARIAAVDEHRCRRRRRHGEGIAASVAVHSQRFYVAVIDGTAPTDRHLTPAHRDRVSSDHVR